MRGCDWVFPFFSHLKLQPGHKGPLAAGAYTQLPSAPVEEGAEVGETSFFPATEGC